MNTDNYQVYLRNLGLTASTVTANLTSFPIVFSQPPIFTASFTSVAKFLLLTLLR
jgi:hypothetical protein